MATTEIYTYLHTLSLHDALPICGGEVDRTGGTQSGIFSKAVPGDDIGLVRKPDTAFLLEHPERRDRVGHDRWLRILGQRQAVGRPFAHQPKQILPERTVDLPEHPPRAGSDEPERAVRWERGCH